MSTGMFVGVGGDAKRVKNIYVGVGGEAKKVIKAYVGDANGQAKLFYSIAQNYITNSNYYVNFSSSFVSFANKSFSKTNSDPAYAGAYYSSANDQTCPIVISQTASAVQYTNSEDSTTASSRGTVNFQGITWYYSGGTNSSSGNFSASPSSRKFTTSHSSLNDIVIDFLNLIYS